MLPGYQPFIAVDGVQKRRERASSNPVSRGGNGVGGLDQEPNPFEQSFSGPRHSSTGPADVTDLNSLNAIAGPSNRRARSTSPPPLTNRTDSSSSIPKLPPLSLIASPGGPVDISGFGWGIDSLRSGPLSPALLNGPAPHHPGIYDTSTLRRSSLTPLSGSSATFPPPSPATAALFAMLTNNTPGTAELGMTNGGARPNEGPNEGNHFEASFARATDVSSLASSKRGSIGSGLDHTRSVSGGDRYQMQQSIPRNNSGGRNLNGPSQLGAQPPQNIPYQLGRNSMQQGAGHLASLNRLPNLPPDRNYGLPPTQNGHNPLYLLSQANDNNEETQAAAAALGNLSGPTGFSPLPLEMNYGTAEDMNGNLPGSIGLAGQNSTLPRHLSPPPVSNAPTTTGKGGRKAATNKRKKAKDDDEEKVVKKPAAKKGKKGKAVEKDYEMDDFEDGEEGSLSPPTVNPNETEEEKRKNFLERNRQGLLLFFCFA